MQRFWLTSALAGLSLGCALAPGESLGGRGAALIYGEDTRLDVHALTDERLRDVALHSAVALFTDSALERDANGRTVVRGEPVGDLLNLCADEPFREQPSAALCSGILVDESLVLTAGHCVTVAACSEQVWAFNFALTRPHALATLGDDDLYRCKSVLVSKTGRDAHGRMWDYALVELDRAVVAPHHAVPLSADIEAGEPVAVVGFPNGIPVKVDVDGQVLLTRSSAEDYFSLTSDTFDVNSGSGVFDDAGRLVGVFVRGGQDYVLAPDSECFTARRLTAPESPEAAEQASYWMPAIRELCDEGLGSERLCSALGTSVTGKPEAYASCSTAEGNLTLSAGAYGPWLVALWLSARRLRRHPPRRSS